MTLDRQNLVNAPTCIAPTLPIVWVPDSAAPINVRVAIESPPCWVTRQQQCPRRSIRHPAHGRERTIRAHCYPHPRCTNTTTNGHRRNWKIAHNTIAPPHTVRLLGLDEIQRDQSIPIRWAVPNRQCTRRRHRKSLAAPCVWVSERKDMMSLLFLVVFVAVPFSFWQWQLLHQK